MKIENIVEDPGHWMNASTSDRKATVLKLTFSSDVVPGKKSNLNIVVETRRRHDGDFETQVGEDAVQYIWYYLGDRWLTSSWEEATEVHDKVVAAWLGQDRRIMWELIAANAWRKEFGDEL